MACYFTRAGPRAGSIPFRLEGHNGAEEKKKMGRGIRNRTEEK
jgi:hypothetical protein